MHARRDEEPMRAGPLEVRPADRIVFAAGRPLMLSVREFRLLTELARSGNRLLSREQLFERAWDQPMRAGDRSVDVYVRKLRLKLMRALPEWRFIHTHVGFGYRFAPERAPDRSVHAGVR